MSEKNKLFFKLCVMDNCIQQAIINVDTMEGLDKSVQVFGFTKEGQPVFTNSPSTYYKLSGGCKGGVDLSGVFNPVKRAGAESGGVRIYERKNGKLAEKAHVYGFEAVSTFLGMKGCAITAEKCEREVTKLLKEKAGRIYCFRLDQLNGLDSYHDKKDEWVFSASMPTFEDVSENYDLVNDLLKKLGSPWRILTDASLQALRKSEFKKLLE